MLDPRTIGVLPRRLAMAHDRDMLGRRATLLIQVCVGVGFLVVGVGSFFVDPASYPNPNDQRNSPFFWIEMGGASAVIGAVILGLAIRDLRRLRDKP